MRVKKFTKPTYFFSDKIREYGFKQNISIENSYKRTIKWIQNSDTKELRNIWYNKASKL